MSTRPSSGVSRGSARSRRSLLEDKDNGQLSGTSHRSKHTDSSPDNKRTGDMPPAKNTQKKSAKTTRSGSNNNAAKTKKSGKENVKPRSPSPEVKSPTPSEPKDDEQDTPEESPGKTEEVEKVSENKEDTTPDKTDDQEDNNHHDPDWKPETIEPEDFDAKEFLSNVSSLKAKLQAGCLRDTDGEYDADTLKEMVNSTTMVMNNLTAFSEHSTRLLEEVREQMRELKELANRKVQSRPYDSKGATNTKVGVEERDIEARHQRLNRELARAGEELARSVQLSLETDKAATEARLLAERAAAEALLIQEEYEQRKRAEQEARRQEAEKKRQEEERRVEQERRQEEARKLEEERRSRLRKRPTLSDVDYKQPEWADWPVFSYSLSGGGAACQVRGSPDHFRESMVQCRAVSQLEVEFEYGDNEELVSSIVRITSPHGDTKLPGPIQIALPHTMSRVSAMAREPVIKARYSDGQWNYLQSHETAFDGHKDTKFVQAEARSFGDFAVVTRFKRDYLTLSKRGGKLTSSVDSRITLQADRGTFPKPEHLVLQLQQVDSATVNEIRLQSAAAKGLLTASSIVAMEWTSQSFNGPVTMTLPCPPNPVKAKKAAAARAAKEAKMKNPTPPVMVKDNSAEARKDKKRRDMKQTQTETEEAEPKRPATAKWYMGQYGSSDDDENDSLFFLHKMSSGRWLVRDFPQVEQVKLDLIQFVLKEPIPKFMVLRTRTNVEADEAQRTAELIENRLSHRVVQSVLKQRSDDLCDVCLELVLSSKTEKTIKQLEEEGYEEGPSPSKEIALCEGDLIEVQFRGNIRQYQEEQENVDDKPLSLVFDSQSENRVQFSVLEVDKFLQKSYQVYRGFVQLYKVSKLVQKPRRRDDGEEEETVVEYKRDLITEHLISIPKEPDLPRVVAKAPVTLRNQNEAVNEDTLRLIASHLGDEWQKVAHHLSIKRIRIQAILRDASVNDLSDEEAKYDMLVTWIKKVPRSVNKVEFLKKALIRSCREDLAAELDRINRELSNKSSTVQ